MPIFPPDPRPSLFSPGTRAPRNGRPGIYGSSRPGGVSGGRRTIAADVGPVKFRLWTTAYGLGGAEPGSEETSPLLDISP
jgi:hypothetical protein